MTCKVLFVGGGSVGHIAPALAIWHALYATNTSATCLFVCAARPDEEEFLKSAHVPYTTISSAKLQWNLPWQLFKSLWQSANIIRTFKPDVIMSKGAYISVPLCIIAFILNIPIVTHESDAVLGRANRFISLLARCICYGLPVVTASKKRVYTGNPVTQSTVHGNTEQGYRRTGVPKELPVLLVMGGSQGAQALNEYITSVLQDVLQYCSVVHITGRGKQIPVTLPIQLQSRYFQAEFITNDMAHIYAITSVALSRAGSNSITELAASSIPSVLVPLRSVGHDHQQKNAELAAASNGFICMQQSELQTKFIPWVQYMCSHTNVLHSMQTSAHTLYVPNAAQNIAEQILAQISRANL